MSAGRETFPVRFGDFALLSSLGVGGMGQAYLAAHPEWPGLVVLKRMHAHFQNDGQIFKRFLHEAKAATLVRHPAVAGAIAVGTVGKEPFLATEYVFGLPLSALVERMEDGRMERPPIGVALYLALDLAKGLEAIHEAVDPETGTPLQLIHRDIGARNVMVGFDGRLRIIDLGLGRSLLSDWETAVDTVSGSPDYMPPEQASGERVDRRADVYSAAVTIFEIFAGKKRIRAETVAERLHLAITAQPETMSHHRPELSSEFDAAMISAMAPEPETRTRHVALLRRALERELSRLAVRSRRQEVVRWLREGTAEELSRMKARRLEAERLASQLLSGPKEETRIHAVAPILEPTPEAFEHEIEDPTQPRAPVSPTSEAPARQSPGPALALGLALGVLVLAVLAVAFLRPVRTKAPLLEPLARTAESGAPSDTTSTPVSPPSGAAAPTSSAASNSDVPAEALAPGPETLISKSPARPLSPASSARKKALAGRLQTLRRSRFDVAYQRQLTQIGQALSRARAGSELDEVERRIKRLESER